jgi:hypothetical protein
LYLTPNTGRRREDKYSVPTTSSAYAFYYTNVENREERLGVIRCDIALEDAPGGRDEEVTLLCLSGNFALVLRPVAGFEATYERIGAITVAVRLNAVILLDLPGLSKPQVINLVYKSLNLGNACDGDGILRAYVLDHGIPE